MDVILLLWFRKEVCLVEVYGRSVIFFNIIYKNKKNEYSFVSVLFYWFLLIYFEFWWYLSIVFGFVNNDKYGVLKN